MMPRKHEYIGVVQTGMGMSLGGSELFVDTICAAVKFTGDGRIVQSGRRYRKGDEPRNLASTASRMARKWQSYFERTGKRFEIEQDAKAAKKRARRHAELEKARKLRERAPDLLASLKRLTKEVRFGDAGAIREEAERATALIAELD